MAIAAVDATDINSGFRQFMTDVESNESFMTVDDILILFCNLCCHLPTWIKFKVKIFVVFAIY